MLSKFLFYFAICTRGKELAVSRGQDWGTKRGSARPRQHFGYSSGHLCVKKEKNPKNRQSLLNICLNFQCPIIMPVMIVCLLCPNTGGSVLNT